MLGYIESGKEEGADVRLGGKRARKDSGGYFVEPTVFDGVTPAMKIAREEIFGPVLSTITFSDVEEAVTIANDVSYGLTAAVWSRDITTAHRIAKRAARRHGVRELLRRRRHHGAVRRLQAVRQRPRQVAARVRQVHRAQDHLDRPLMKVTVAATQMACSWDREANVANAERLVREAAKQGANVILIQELFEAPYFCKDHLAKHFELAVPVAENTAIKRLAKVAKELKVVLPLSVFERAQNAYFNTLVMVDADGETLGIYRKSHIPESPGYHEKFYFSPGDTGFKVWPTRFGNLGVAVCWDQWFPETARVMALQGADILFYPTAIGSEPQDPTLDSRYHWQRTMQGHAAANVMPLVASNRIGTEKGEKLELTFYGHSFIADHTGAVIAQADDHSEQILTASFDLDEIRRYRHAWGVFRDRRPDLYGPLLKLDGGRG